MPAAIPDREPQGKYDLHVIKLQRVRDHDDKLAAVTAKSDGELQSHGTIKDTCTKSAAAKCTRDTGPRH